MFYRVSSSPDLCNSKLIGPVIYGESSIRIKHVYKVLEGMNDDTLNQLIL